MGRDDDPESRVDDDEGERGLGVWEPEGDDDSDGLGADEEAGVGSRYHARCLAASRSASKSLCRAETWKDRELECMLWKDARVWFVAQRRQRARTVWIGRNDMLETCSILVRV